ncbi:hypothetical protein HU200_014086 [Digitaria exilis]|uniref:UBC core domain-containing protein n=1 Tax=Digitaria exilis TaxID=1010633 RepID=A0A835KKI2_9POAL|nr:hypothetical protein HU200_014086 [Digitaria exilis]CAB3447758.1 unnamed protein product [Digitaria exilis]
MGASPSSPTPTNKAAEPSNRRKIRKELNHLWVDPPPFCRPGASPVTDLLHWEAIIDGPTGSPYAGGTFPVRVDFSDDHPMKPPTIAFMCKVYHPNVDSEGKMVLDIFKEEWSPILTIEKLLLSMVSVLYDPMLDRPINGRIARLYKSDVKMYERKAMGWTRRYASTPVVSYYPEKGDDNWGEYCDAIAVHDAELEKKERRRVAADAASARRHSKVASSPCEKGPKVLWRRTVAFLQGRRPVALPSTVKAVAV